MNRVAFILHPLNVSEFRNRTYLYYPFNFIAYFLLKIFPDRISKKIYSFLPAHVFLTQKIRSKIGSYINLVGIMCTVFPEQITTNRQNVINKIKSAVVLSKKCKTDIVVLTGFTSIATNQGKDIREFIGEEKINITSGNTYTASLAIEGIKKACEYFEIDMKKSKIGIIGATGDIGSACAKKLAMFFGKIILSSRNINQNSEISKELNVDNVNYVIENDAYKAIKNANVVLIATSSIFPMFDLSDFSPKTIVVDVSMPTNIKSGDNREDIFVYDGGKAVLEKNLLNIKWKGFTDNDFIYGCLAEGIILGLEDIREDYSLGQGGIRQDKLEEIYDLGNKHGIRLAPFSFHNKIYSVSDLRKIKEQFIAKN